MSSTCAHYEASFALRLQSLKSIACRLGRTEGSQGIVHHHGELRKRTVLFDDVTTRALVVTTARSLQSVALSMLRTGRLSIIIIVIIISTSIRRRTR